MGGKDPGSGVVRAQAQPSHGPAAAPCGGGRGRALSLPTTINKGLSAGSGWRTVKRAEGT